jgi:hypothetical protein
MKGLHVKIIEAIGTADNEHVVYFLLTAYVETLDYYDPLRSCLPEDVKSLPIAGISDVAARLRTLRRVIVQYAQSQMRLLLQEALDVFHAALRRLTEREHAFGPASTIAG